MLPPITYKGGGGAGQDEGWCRWRNLDGQKRISSPSVALGEEVKKKEISSPSVALGEE
jgi:hypothetical protein